MTLKNALSMRRRTALSPTVFGVKAILNVIESPGARVAGRAGTSINANEAVAVLKAMDATRPGAVPVFVIRKVVLVPDVAPTVAVQHAGAGESVEDVLDRVMNVVGVPAIRRLVPPHVHVERDTSKAKFFLMMILLALRGQPLHIRFRQRLSLILSLKA